MDSNIARWVQLVEWDTDDILELHRRETLLKKSSDASVAKRGPNLTVTDHAFIQAMQTRYQMHPFWNRNMTEQERAAEINNFERAIFPIWKGIALSDIEAENKPGAPEGSAIETLHRQDIAVEQSGKRINRMNGGTHGETRTDMSNKLRAAAGGY